MKVARNILIVGQAGRLEAEALLFAASWRDVGSPGRLIVANVQPGLLWPGDASLSQAGVEALTALGAQVWPLHVNYFGAAYPQGNKIEALQLLPGGEPFVFFDTDSILLGDVLPVLQNAPPGAMERVEQTWPKPQKGGPGRVAIWRALYTEFEMTAPDVPPYYCAARFHGPCPAALGGAMLQMACHVLENPPAELLDQALLPWLDQIVLPLALHQMGGGPDPARSALLDTQLSWHYRSLALAQARAPAHVLQRLAQLTQTPEIRDLLARHAPFRRMMNPQTAAQVRKVTKDLRNSETETPVRKRLRRAGFWDR